MIKFCAVAILFIMTLASSLPQNVYAQPVTLQQEVLLIDCTNTQTQSGSGVTNLTDCNGTIAPVIDTQSTTSNRQIITGTFDAMNARKLRVFFSGVWYVFNQSPELTVVGDYWRLDLTTTYPLPSPGVYTVIVEVVTTQSQLLRSSMSYTIAATPIQPQPPHGDGSPHPGQIAQPRHTFLLQPDGTSSLLAPVGSPDVTDFNHAKPHIDNGARTSQSIATMLGFAAAIVIAAIVYGVIRVIATRKRK